MKIISQPALIKAEGEPVKTILEFVGKVNSGTDEMSIAKMKSPEGWSEPGQTPDFTEYTIMLAGTLVIETKNGRFEAKANEIVVADKGEWVRYSSPFPGGAEYFALCVPAFTPDRANRD